MRSWNCPFTSPQTGTGHQTSCTLDFFVRISLAFLQRLLIRDTDSCSIHWSSSLVNTCSSMMSPAWTGYCSLLLLLVPDSLDWWLLGTGAGPLARPSVLSHWPLPSSTLSRPDTLLSVISPSLSMPLICLKGGRRWSCLSYRSLKVLGLEQVSATPLPGTSKGPWPIENRYAQQKVSSRPVSEASSVFKATPHHSSITPRWDTVLPGKQAQGSHWLCVKMSSIISSLCFTM